MKMEDMIRVIAGSLVLISLALAHYVNPNWLWLTVFVGANLLQSSFTRWCLMEDILRTAGFSEPDQTDRPSRHSTPSDVHVQGSR